MPTKFLQTIYLLLSFATLLFGCSKPEKLSLSQAGGPITTTGGDLRVVSCDGIAEGTIESRVHYKSAEVDSDKTCESEDQSRSCTDGELTEWTGTFTSDTCSVKPPDQQFLNCGFVNHGSSESQIRFQSQTVPFGQECKSEIQTRSCSNGSFGGWSGTYSFTTCVVSPQTNEPVGLPCGSVASGTTESRIRYQSTSVPYGQICAPQNQSRTCQNGAFTAWTGTYTQTQCNIAPPASCGATSHGTKLSRIRYQQLSVNYGQQCKSEIQYQTCDNGSFSPWSGSFEFASCSVAPQPVDTQKSCGIVAHGGTETRERFEKAHVDFNQTCKAQNQTRTCNNGEFSAWTGTYSQVGCEVDEAPSTKLWAGKFGWQCATNLAGKLYCWGSNNQGQLGFGTKNEYLVPTLHSIDAIQMEGSIHGCGLFPGGIVKCWGSSSKGQLGLGNKVSMLEPTQIPDLEAVEVTGGTRHSCALLKDGSAKCWGDNTAGQLGINDNSVVELSVPTDVVGPHPKKIQAGGNSTCAIRADDQVECWGWNSSKELGLGHSDPVFAPALVGTFKARSISVGIQHACANLFNDDVVCWGNQFPMSNDRKPTTITGIKAKSVSSGYHHSCAILLDDRVTCWGKNLSGQLGLGQTSNASMPVIGTSLTAKQVVAGYDHTCIVTLDDKVYCWGGNVFGQLGVGDKIDRLNPIEIVLP